MATLVSVEQVAAPDARGRARSAPPASVADVVGGTIAAQGVKDAFGILGSGNLVVTNALTQGGARFHHARLEPCADQTHQHAVTHPLLEKLPQMRMIQSVARYPMSIPPSTIRMAPAIAWK